MDPQLQKFKSGDVVPAAGTYVELLPDGGTGSRHALKQGAAFPLVGGRAVYFVREGAPLYTTPASAAAIWATTTEYGDVLKRLAKK